MKKLLFLILLSSSIFAQDKHYIDSVKALTQSKIDTIRFGAYTELTWVLKDVDKTDAFKPWLPVASTTDVLTQIHFSGSTSLQKRLRTLCTEFRDIFSNELPAKPAAIPEFDLVVDNKKWKVNRNRMPPRQQSPVKQTELYKTIETLRKQGIIEKSQSPHYSQTGWQLS